MNLTELTKLIEALTAAGITNWLLVFLVLFTLSLVFLIVVAIRVVPTWLRNMREKSAQESAFQLAFTNVVTALTANITAQTATNDTLVKNITVLTKNQTAMQEGMERRNDQMDRMNEIQLQSATTATEQSKLLLQQNALLEGLARTSESGNTYVRSLTESIIASTKDNSAAINAWGKTSTEHTNRVGADIVDKINNIPGEVIKQATPAIEAIREDLNKILSVLPAGNEQLIMLIVAKVSEDIRHIVGEMITKVIAETLTQTQQMAAGFDADKTIKLGDPIIHPKTGSTGPLPPLPSSTSPAPTTNTVSATADGGAA